MVPTAGCLRSRPPKGGKRRARTASGTPTDPSSASCPRSACERHATRVELVQSSKRPDGTQAPVTQRSTNVVRTYARSPAERLCSGCPTISQGEKSAASWTSPGSTRVRVDDDVDYAPDGVSEERSTWREIARVRFDLGRRPLRRLPGLVAASDPGQPHDDERHSCTTTRRGRRAPPADASHARHVPRTRLVRRRSVQTRNSVRIASGRSTIRGSGRCRANGTSRGAPAAALRLCAALGGLLPPQPDRRQPAGPRVAQRDDDPARRPESSAPRSDPG